MSRLKRVTDQSVPYITTFILTTLNQVKRMNPGIQTSLQCLHFPHPKLPLGPRKQSRTLPYPISISTVGIRRTVMSAIASRRRFRSNNTIAGVEWTARRNAMACPRCAISLLMAGGRAQRRSRGGFVRLHGGIRTKNKMLKCKSIK